MQVTPEPAASGLAVDAEQFLELREQIGVRPEMTESMVASLERLSEPLLHLRTVIAVQAVAFDECGLDVFAAEDLLERAHDRGGPRS